MQTTTCPACGHEIHLSEHPFCPHGYSVVAMVHDEIPGGMVLHNYGPEPITVYSHTERRALLQRVQYDKLTHTPYTLHERETFAPLPGTDRDPSGIPNPAGYRDLSAAAIIARNGRSSTEATTDPADREDIANDPGYRDPHWIPIKAEWSMPKS